MADARIMEGKLYGEIADAIAGRILSGALRPGDRLPSERDLSHEFRVSRPTIREAMIALEVRGLVRTAERSGVFVLEPAHWASSQDRPLLRRTMATASTAELIETMAVLLPQVAALAARSFTAEKGKAQPDVTAGGDPLLIFCHLAEIAGNVAIGNIVTALIEAASAAGLSAGMDRRPGPGMTQTLLEAVYAGDADAAARASRVAMAHVFATWVQAEPDAPDTGTASISEQRRKLASRHPLAFAP